MRIKILGAILFVCMFVVVSGCGEKLPYEVAGIAGTVTFDGKPAPKGLVLQFLPANGEGRQSEAVVGDEGKFKATYTPSVKGVQVGKVVLKVRWGAGSDFDAPPDAAAIIKKYGGETAGFPMEVTKADKEFKIDLK